MEPVERWPALIDIRPPLAIDPSSIDRVACSELRYRYRPTYVHTQTCVVTLACADGRTYVLTSVRTTERASWRPNGTNENRIGVKSVRKCVYRMRTRVSKRTNERTPLKRSSVREFHLRCIIDSCKENTESFKFASHIERPLTDTDLSKLIVHASSCCRTAKFQSVMSLKSM